MDFFHSLPLDLKMMVVGIAGFALLALFSGNQKAEKRYMLVLAVLTAAGVYRFTHIPSVEPAQATNAAVAASHVVKVAPQHVPLVSTSAK